MRYKKLGNTDIEISVLGFGCMRFPMIKTDKGDDVDRERLMHLLERHFALG